MSDKPWLPKNPEDDNFIDAPATEPSWPWPGKNEDDDVPSQTQTPQDIEKLQQWVVTAIMRIHQAGENKGLKRHSR
jgi:hypothetical protein